MAITIVYTTPNETDGTAGYMAYIPVFQPSDNISMYAGNSVGNIDQPDGRDAFVADLMKASRPLSELAAEAIKADDQGKTRKFPE